jgi:acyl-CoA dehydrogenase
MLLLNPRDLSPFGLDAPSRALVEATVAFFEKKGRKRLKDDDRDRVWYRDFLDFQREKKLFATFLTPAPLGGGATRWDTFRNGALNEVLAFYGLAYWYT